jgi:hypothetical protein
MRSMRRCRISPSPRIKHRNQERSMARNIVIEKRRKLNSDLREGRKEYESARMFSGWS